ncbi:phosphate acetyltransferase [Robiginitalea myxolifaciens]|uniref:Phosphate acetyltransferase n=1 Tax=Robiginitalea myxolifaciens TaxID=400055 RepID=A0A1I6FN12_9FLAO|nr:phosphate acetyltransferase [Robiginitalea myxolifaciens]SFR31321.1 phosphate acetyltransferase [Robiginitalea myxolifaciens]
MTKAIYIATLESHSGKSLVVLGLMQLLLGKMAKVGYFRPVIDDIKSQGIDNHIKTVVSHFNLNLEPEDAYALTQSQVIDMYNDGRQGDILDLIFDKYKRLEKEFDFILVEGSDFASDGSIIEFDLNIDICKNLGIPVVLVDNAKGKILEEFAGNLESAVNSYLKRGIEILGVVANKVRPENLELVRSRLTEELQGKTTPFAVPRVKNLSHPTIAEIVEELQGEILFGGENLNNQTGSFGVGAMQLHNYLTHLRDNSLVITPGDRSDIILGALQANLSDNYPAISGIILTGGIKPEESIMKLLHGFETQVPIISVQQGTFGAANAVGNIKSKIYAESKQKIATSIALFNEHVDGELMIQRLDTYQPKGLTPRMFQYNLLQKAKKDKKHIVLPEGDDPRILEAASELATLDIADITLLGDRELIEKKAQNQGFDISRLAIINPTASENFEAYSAQFYELRKHKGVNMDMARDVMQDVSYFGTMMVYMGHADGMVSGAAHTTQHTIRPALQFIKTKPGIRVVSSVFFMCLENRVSVFGDCAINPNPTADQLAEIAISSAASSEAFGIPAKIAMLSYSSGSSGKGEDVDKVRKATEIVKQTQPHLQIEGPIQYDAAVDPLVGKSKLPDSAVAGQASVLIFPDLNTGNNTYKAVQRETGAIAIGPMLQGLNKPVNDLSRGCTVEDIFNTVIVTAIQAQKH